ncbi:MAG TPA: DNA-formamidopyrimidine glycosylase [Leptolyngbyaceae cyanobacterium M33_DOE_097]|uniref:Formamidopyrimidine-DNA glycosylase n=1 Tax=Oscillatoriales cyanobacterium SpSt-418 TaxID=2282169 RepID=A0A7C3PH99_9CYAN|nr:DNA-formamidopyrimidine glycosylase [Leptolyngbyaceae cyanobacterium M33_DOE_097]
MPELPEVETVKRGLNKVTLHQVIQGGEVLLERTVAHPVSIDGFLAPLAGQAIAQWQRRGKYLLAALTDVHNALPEEPLMAPSGGWLGVHLRMTGQLLWLDPTEPVQKHTRVRLFFETGKELRFVDQRTFGQMWWVPPGIPPEQVMTGLQQLGPEPFSEEFSISYLYNQLQNRQRPIKNALLDQAIVAGIGNIYADEALFLSGIRPQTLCSKINRKKFQQLHGNILTVLAASIEAQGTTFSSFRNVEGVNGNYGRVAWVYGRDGEACRTCGAVIERLRLAGRSAHFCPKCQK